MQEFKAPGSGKQFEAPGRASPPSSWVSPVLGISVSIQNFLDLLCHFLPQTHKHKHLHNNTTGMQLDKQWNNQRSLIGYVEASAERSSPVALTDVYNQTGLGFRV